MNRFRILLVLTVVAASAGAAAARVLAAGSTPHPASHCPVLTNRTARTPAPVLRDLGRQVRALFNSPAGAYRGYEIQAVVSLARTAPDPPAIRVAKYRRLAAAACGTATAHRSWAVVVWFPNSRAATVGQQVYWLAPTADGWQVWWSWNPLPGWDRTGEFPAR